MGTPGYVQGIKGSFSGLCLRVYGLRSPSQAACRRYFQRSRSCLILLAADTVISLQHHLSDRYYSCFFWVIYKKVFGYPNQSSAQVLVFLLTKPRTWFVLALFFDLSSLLHRYALQQILLYLYLLSSSSQYSLQVLHRILNLKIYGKF